MKPRAKLNDFFWHIVSRGSELQVIKSRDNFEAWASDQYFLGNYFLDKEDAVKAKDAILRILKV